VELDALEGPAVVIDAVPWCATRRDCQVRREDLIDFERLRGKIPQGAVVLIKTGFSRWWGEKERYLGYDVDKKDQKPHHPGLHPAAAEWLAENRKPKLVVIDGPSIDYGPSKLYETHRALFARNIPVIENAANLELLPQTGAQVLALPAKIKGASSAPVRLAAVVDPVR
jgi:kynurenine formamidase